MHIYAFGSICRGDISRSSDVDLLAITNTYDERLSLDVFSIYSYARIEEIWSDGNPFAWHLYAESKLIYGSDGKDFLKSLGMPSEYTHGIRDCEKFHSLFSECANSIHENGINVFECSTIFLAIRNMATCFSLFVLGEKNFSRDSALLLAEQSIMIRHEAYETLKSARMLSVRGYGEMIQDNEFWHVLNEIENIKEWMDAILAEVVRCGRV